MKSVTVFVRRMGGQFHANTFSADAMSTESALAAVRACAARHFNVPEVRIALDPDSDHVVIASVMPPAPARDRTLLLLAAGSFATALGLWFIFWRALR